MNIESKIYDLNNSFLSQDEKVQVESWFQLPGNIMEYVFWTMSILSIFYPISLFYIFGISIIFNIVVGLVNWHFYNRKLVTTLGLSIFHPYVETVVGIVVAIFLFIKGSLLLAGLSIFVGIFGFLFLELHILLYSILARRYKIHPKYVFAEKYLSHKFSSEESNYKK